jgi:hypothetical protein
MMEKGFFHFSFFVFTYYLIERLFSARVLYFLFRKKQADWRGLRGLAG